MADSLGMALYGEQRRGQGRVSGSVIMAGAATIEVAVIAAEAVAVAVVAVMAEAFAGLHGLFIK